MAGRKGAGREPRLDRRSWLVAAGLGLGVVTTARSDDPSLTPDEAKARDEVLARAKEAGLPRLKVHTSARFFALSDTSEAFTRQALTICEDLLTDYLAYFPPRKFAVQPPARRMTLVILATPKDIVENPKGIKVRELEAATLPRVLSQVDLALIRTTAQELLGTSGGGGLALMKYVPDALRMWLSLPPRENAIEDYQSWEKCLVESFGPRKFVKLEINPADVYAAK